MHTNSGDKVQITTLPGGMKDCPRFIMRFASSRDTFTESRVFFAWGFVVHVYVAGNVLWDSRTTRHACQSFSEKCIPRRDNNHPLTAVHMLAPSYLAREGPLIMLRYDYVVLCALLWRNKDMLGLYFCHHDS